MNVSASRDKVGQDSRVAGEYRSAPRGGGHGNDAGCDAQSGSAGKSSRPREITSHNTFEKPAVVEPAAFKDAKITETGFTATLPAKSVVVLEIEG